MPFLRVLQDLEERPPGRAFLLRMHSEEDVYRPCTSPKPPAIFDLNGVVEYIDTTILYQERPLVYHFVL